MCCVYALRLRQLFRFILAWIYSHSDCCNNSHFVYLYHGCSKASLNGTTGCPSNEKQFICSHNVFTVYTGRINRRTDISMSLLESYEVSEVLRCQVFCSTHGCLLSCHSAVFRWSRPRGPGLLPGGLQRGFHQGIKKKNKHSDISLTTPTAHPTSLPFSVLFLLLKKSACRKTFLKTQASLQRFMDPWKTRARKSPEDTPLLMWPRAPITQ